MELNHMSPPPTSPTPTSHEDDECRTDVTDLAIDSVTLLICLCGLVGNGAIKWLVCKNPLTTYIHNLAVANLIFLLTMLTSSIIYIMENVSCSSAVTFNPKYFSLYFLFSYNMGLYLLTAISIKRCVSILCPLSSCCCRPQCVSTMVCDLLWALSIAVIIPVVFLCPRHEHCQIALISMYAINLFIFAPSMVISSTILLIKVHCGSQQHQPKRLYIAIFLTVLLFLLFALPLSIWNFLQQFSYIIVPSQVLFLLACINSSLNPFIYFLVGSYQRQCSLGSLQNALRRVFEEQEGNRECRKDIAMDALAPVL
ncbi:mas-related G-protein coupled receptor member H-like [Porphyrio hochstetteri]